MKIVFLRALEADDKATAVRDAISNPETARGKRRFEVDAATFGAIPRTPFAYWVSEGIRKVFRECPAFETGERTATRGASTCDDFRYVRLWTEVAPGQTSPFRWVPFTKGGRFARFYAPIPTAVCWDESRLTFGGFIGRPGRWIERPEALDQYFQPAITWPLRGIVFSGQAVPRGCIFSIGGKVAIVPKGELDGFLALFNSAAFDAFIRLYAGKVGGVQYEVGLIQSLPVPKVQLASVAQLGTLARHAWSLKRRLDTHTETSHAFTLPTVLQVRGGTLTARTDVWNEQALKIEAELATIQVKIDELCFDLYGINEADRYTISEGLEKSADTFLDSAETNADANGADANGDTGDEDARVADATDHSAQLLSWAVGAAFGRFDVRLTTGERPLPAEPDPFDPLPVCSPGMLTTNAGLPCETTPLDYPFIFPENGMLVDDPGHPRDITAATRTVFETVFGIEADARWQDAAAFLDPKDHDLRSWLATDLFDHHLKRYSKSRRKAPIIWQLATSSGRYSLWLYAQRLTRDSFFQVQDDFVAPKLAHEERELSQLIHDAGVNATASQRKDIATQEAFVGELRTMLDDVKRVAPLFKSTLDDGVVLTMAPLWRLVPHHKSWQKELKSKWDELVAGKYDWAHLAMHLWPERVVPKCVTDRSLAIVHGLEDIFWVKGSDGKWKPRIVEHKTIAQLIKERTSPAVKDALARLMEAPGASVRRLPEKKGKR